MEERRNFSRRNTAREESISLQISLRVKILDINVSGALVESPSRVDPGSRGRLWLTLDSTPFAIEVEILRVAEEFGTGSGCRLGTRFIPLDRGQERLIESLIMRES